MSAKRFRGRFDLRFYQVMRLRTSIFASLLSITTIGTAFAFGGGSFKLRLLHTNDMHARFEQVSQSAGKCSEYEVANKLCYGGFARVHTALEEELARAQRENVSVLSLNAGDTYQGTVWYTIYKWRVVSHFLKMLKIDAMALGNHEFDDGIKGLTPFLKDVGIPIVAANIDFSPEPEIMNTSINRYLTFKKMGKIIGVIGYLTPETVTLANAGKLKFRNEIEALTEETKHLKNLGIKIIIVVGHSGYEMDLKIAAEVPNVDVVVGGHSHTFLYTGQPPDSDKPADVYPVMVTQKNGRKVAMVQAYAFTKYLGVLDLKFDERGELLEAKGNPILLNHKVAEDPRVLQEVNEWKSKLNETLKQSIGKTKVLLDASLCRFYECNLGNLITDAYVHYATKSDSSKRPLRWSKAAIAIQQAGGIRTSINATASNGTITREDVITSMPFFSPLSVVSIKGKYLLEALEWSVARYDVGHQWGRGEFVQVSGLKVRYDMGKPSGSRVVSLKIRCQYCEIPRFQSLRLESDYDIIMPTFLLNGGDNFKMFKEHGIETDKFAHSDTETVINYLEEKGIIYSGVEDRIEIFEGTENGSYHSKPNFTYLCIVLSIKFLLIK